MTVGYGPLLRRDGPPPAGRNNTLLQVAAAMGLLITDDDAHWQNGIALQPYTPGPAGSFDPCGTGTDSIKAAGEGIPLPEFGPVEIYFSETCTARVVGPEDQWFINRATAGLGGAQEAAVENVLATGGAVFDNPHLTDTNLDILNVGTGSGFSRTWTAMNPVEALALLEEQIGGTKKGGIIHAPPAVVTYWSRYHLLQEASQKGPLFTKSGTPIVDGYGYIGAVPDGSNFAHLTAIEDWAFATGPVKIWMDPAALIYPGSYKEALDRHTNTLTYRAERPFVITWDQVLQAGVLIDRSIDP